MAKVNITNVTVLDNPSPFQNPFQFEITFECLEDLKEDLEWKIIYVGSAESEEYDQILDTVLVGPLVGGKHKFVFQADSPDTNKIPLQDAVGVTVVLLTCAYKEQEFIRVGYYVNNEYLDQEMKENIPSTPMYDKLQRNILATCPRVTRFRIDWSDTPEGDNAENMPPPYNTESESNQMAMDSAAEGSTSLKDAESLHSNGPVVSNGDSLSSEKIILSGSTTDNIPKDSVQAADTTAETPMDM